MQHSKKVIYRFSILIVLLFLTILIKAQKNKLWVGTQIPLCYQLGYEHKLSNQLGIDFRIGIITKPYDKAIISILEVFDFDELLLKTAGDAFQVGYNFQLTPKWYFRKIYFGTYYSYFLLRAKDRPADIIEKLYQVEIDGGRIDNRYLTLSSSLHNIGVLVGYPIPLINPSWEFNVELALAKTIASKSKLSGESGEFAYASEIANEQLNEYYLKYGYEPSLNIYLIYHF